MQTLLTKLQLSTAPRDGDKHLQAALSSWLVRFSDHSSSINEPLCLLNLTQLSFPVFFFRLYIFYILLNHLRYELYSFRSHEDLLYGRMRHPPSSVTLLQIHTDPALGSEKYRAAGPPSSRGI